MTLCPPLTYNYTGLGQILLAVFIPLCVALLLCLPCRLACLLVLLALPGCLAYLACVVVSLTLLACSLTLLALLACVACVACLACLGWLVALWPRLPCLVLSYLTWLHCTRVSRALSYQTSGLALITLTPRRLLAFSLLCFVLSACAFSTCSALWQARQIVSRLAGSSLRPGACLTLCKWCTVVAGVKRPARLHT